jgi:hypothetical protein
MAKGGAQCNMCRDSHSDHREIQELFRGDAYAGAFEIALYHVTEF